MRTKRKNYFCVLIILLVFIEITTIFLMYKSSNNKNTLLDNVSLKEQISNMNGLAIMIEVDGEYVETNAFPNEGYKFNELASGCIDNLGNKLENILSYKNDKAYLEIGNTGYCYLYFDIDKSFAIYSQTDNSLRFYNNEDYKTISSQNVYNNLEVTKTYTNIDSSTYNILYDANGVSTAATTPWNDIASSIKKVVVEEEISPISTVGWFYKFVNSSSFDVSKLNTGRVTDMQRMFQSIGSNLTNVTVTGLEGWNTSNVTNMSNMFISAALNAETFNIDVSNWDVSQVTETVNMFASAGKVAINWNIGDLSNWNTESLINMSSMFTNSMGAQKFNIGNIGKWNTSNVTNMSGLFLNAGYKATEWYVGDLSNWDTSKVGNMSQMFMYSGESQGSVQSSIRSVGDIGKWNTSNVTNMSGMFEHFCRRCPTVNMDLSNWNTSSVNNMSEMFLQFGYNSSEINLGDIGKWNTSNVMNMNSMFSYFGYNSSEINLGDIGKWNTSNVTNMGAMFSNFNFTNNYVLDLSGWNVKKVTNHGGFDNYVQNKIISPTWQY